MLKKQPREGVIYSATEHAATYVCAFDRAVCLTHDSEERVTYVAEATR
jgi:hypothetical protein